MKILKLIVIELVVNLIFIVGIWVLWNWLMPSIIMAKKISIIEAWGLRALVQFCVALNKGYKNESKF